MKKSKDFSIYKGLIYEFKQGSGANLNTIKHLLSLFLNTENNFDINAKLTHENNKTLLHIAIENDCSIEIIKALLEIEGVDVNIKDADGKTPLFFVLKNQFKSIVHLLAEQGVEFNTLTQTGSTALFLAVQESNYDILEQLLLYGGDPDILDAETGLSPIELAIQNKDVQSVELLALFGALAGKKINVNLFSLMPNLNLDDHILINIAFIDNTGKMVTTPEAKLGEAIFTQEQLELAQRKLDGFKMDSFDEQKDRVSYSVLLNFLALHIRYLRKQSDFNARDQENLTELYNQLCAICAGNTISLKEEVSDILNPSMFLDKIIATVRSPTINLSHLAQLNHTLYVFNKFKNEVEKLRNIVNSRKPHIAYTIVILGLITSGLISIGVYLFVKGLNRVDNSGDNALALILMVSGLLFNIFWIAPLFMHIIFKEKVNELRSVFYKNKKMLNTKKDTISAKNAIVKVFKDITGFMSDGDSIQQEITVILEDLASPKIKVQDFILRLDDLVNNINQLIQQVETAISRELGNYQDEIKNINENASSIRIVGMEEGEHKEENNKREESLILPHHYKYINLFQENGEPSVISHSSDELNTELQQIEISIDKDFSSINEETLLLK